MKKIIISLMLGVCLASSLMASKFGSPKDPMYFHEVTASTFNVSAVNISSNAVTLVSLSSVAANGYDFYAISLFNITSSSIVYTLSTSSTSSGSPALTCANGPLIGSGSETTPYILTEQFYGFYMWALACGNSDVIVRRVIRGR